MFPQLMIHSTHSGSSAPGCCNSNKAEICRAPSSYRTSGLKEQCASNQRCAANREDAKDFPLVSLFVIYRASFFQLSFPSALQAHREDYLNFLLQLTVCPLSLRKKPISPMIKPSRMRA